MAQGVTIDFNANLANFSRSIDRATNKLDKFARDGKATNSKLSSSFSSLGKSIGGLFAGLSIGFLARQTKIAIEFGDSIAKTADNVGLAVESLQEYRFAANRSGVDTSLLESSLTAFVKRVGEARNGVGPLVSGLKKYDKALLDNIVNAKNQEEALNIVADAIGNAKDAAERASIANAAFSRSGVKLANIFFDGAKGVEELKKQARDTGFVIEESLTRKAEVINDRWDTLTDTIGNKFKAALITAADASLNFFKIYNDLNDTILALDEAEQRLFATEERVATARGRNKRAAEIARDVAKKDIGVLIEQEEAFRKIEERIKSLKDIQDLDLNDDTLDKSKDEILDFSKTINDKFNPSNKVTEDLDKIERAFSRGLISPDVYADAIFEAMQRIEDTVSTTDSGIKAFAKSLDELNDVADNLSKIDEAFADGLISFDTYADAVFEQFDRINKQFDDISDKGDEIGAAWKDASRILASGFEDAIVEGEKFRDILKEIGRDILRLFIRTTITSQATEFFTGIFEGISGRAIGGPVTGGTPYIVGEKGPELFVPPSSGTIVPNGEFSGQAVNQYITINANGADNATAESLKRTAARMGRDMVFNEIQRNGPIRQII